MGVTFWTPLNNADTDLTDIDYPPQFILRNLIDILKYFPKVNSTSLNNATTAAMQAISQTSVTNKPAQQNSLSQRCRQFSYSATSSTCDSDCQQQQCYASFFQKTNQQTNNNNNRCMNPPYKYRRGVSLPKEHIYKGTTNS